MRVGSTATVFVQFLAFSVLIRRLGTTPPASGASPPSTELDQGTLFASAYAAAGTTGRIEVVDSDGHLRSCHSDLGGIVRGRGNRSFGRLAGSRRIMVGSWNVGSLTRKFFELGDVLRRHKVDIACFQETKWKGSRAKEGNGYKLWYSRSSIARNSVGIILDGRHKDNVVRVGLSDADKKRFWDALDEMVRKCPTNQRLIIGGDLNGHIGAAADGYAEVHGGFGFGDRNKEGCTVLEFATAHDLVNLNGEAIETFKATIFERLVVEDMSASNADQMWNTLSCVMKDVAKDLSEGNQEDIDRTRERYKVAKREAKIAVAKAKDKAYGDLYKKLDSKEGVNEIYKIAKAQERRIRDIGNVKYIKDEGGRTIVKEEDIRTRWGEYFLSFFNETPSEESRSEGSGEVGRSSSPAHFDCYYSRINHEEMRAALHKMGRNKAVGPNQIPIEAWRCLGDEGGERGTEYFPVNLGLHQGSAISPYPFTLILDELSSGIQENIPWCMIFADDIVLIAESAKRLNNRLESWRKTLEDNGLRTSYAVWLWVLADHESSSIQGGCGGIENAEVDLRLRWFGHVKRRPQSAPVRRVEAMVVEGWGRRSRPKLRWEDKLKMDMKELRLSKDMTFDRIAWRDRIRISM
nr:hypothetical protein [Tanacetum cinerariifolium]